MNKRKICVVAVCFLAVRVLLGVFLQTPPLALEKQFPTGGEITFRGTVYQREEIERHHVVSLKNIHIIYDKQFIANKQTVEASDSQVLKQTKLLVYIPKDSISNNSISSNSTPKNSNLLDATSIVSTSKKSNQLSSNSKGLVSEYSHQKDVTTQKYAQDNILIGNQIQVSGTLRFFEEARNPGNFNQKFHYQKQGIEGLVWADQIQVLIDDTDTLREWLYHIRTEWKAGLLERLGEEYGGIVSALLLGERREIDQETRMLYQKSGIGHILAISGLHMSFLGMGIYLLLRKLGLSILSTGLFGIGLLLLYTLMIGFSASTMRAFLMFVLKMGGEMAGRNYDTPTSLAFAAVFVLLWRPLYLTDAGFLFSFGAILGLAILLPLLEGLFPEQKKRYVKVSSVKKWHYRIRKRIKQGLMANLSIHLMLLPILLYFYFEFPLYSIFLNMLIVPLLSLLLGVALLGSALMWISPFLSDGIFIICRGILWLYESACQLTLSLPMSRIVLGRPQSWQIFSYYLLLFSVYLITMTLMKRSSLSAGFLSANKETAPDHQSKFHTSRGCGGGVCNLMRKTKLVEALIITLYIWKKEKQKTVNPLLQSPRNTKVVLVSLLLAMILSMYPGYQFERELMITMIDVGQGDGIYIRTPRGQHILVDGGSSSVPEVGRYRITPFLASRGISELDYVFVSHGDGDHLSGIREMLTQQKLGITIHTLILPPVSMWDDVLWELAHTANENSTKVRSVAPGEGIKEGEFRLVSLAPTAEHMGPVGNDTSMVLSLTYKGFTMLFTGDAEEGLEAWLVDNYTLEKYTVLKVAHHGSRTSSSEIFLSAIRPQISLISSGVNNRFGHPHADVVERLEAFGSRIYRTNGRGAILMWTDGERLKIDTFLRKASQT